MAIIGIAFLFVLGLFAGGWLSRIAYRLPREIPLFHKPNFCTECGYRLAIAESIPLFSWIRLGKRCAHCMEPIPFRYPVLELVTAILWALEGWRLTTLRGLGTSALIGIMAVELLFLSMMVVVVLVDWEFLVIPDEISLGGTIAGLASASILPVPLGGGFPDGEFDGWGNLLHSFAGAIGGIAVMLVLYYAGKALFKSQIRNAQAQDPEIDSVLGLGDVKLMGCFGAFLGFEALFPLFLIAVFSGSVAGIYLKLSSGEPGDAKGFAALRNRWRNGDSFFPFGPFLALGAIIMLYLR